MAADFFIKQHDRLPEISSTLQDANATAVDVTGCTVRFILTNKATGTLEFDKAATIVTAASGIVKYSWADGDTDNAGTYKAEWEVTFGDGRAETFPNSTYLIVKITADLGGTA